MVLLKLKLLIGKGNNNEIAPRKITSPLTNFSKFLAKLLSKIIAQKIFP